MHIDTEVMRGAVHHVAAVVLGFGVERLARADRQETPLCRLLGDDGHRGRVDLAEADAGLHDRQSRVRRLPHRLIHLPLHRGEGAVDRKCAGDVRRVQAVELDAGIDQDQVTRDDRAVVGGPVQDAGMRPARRDRVVADRVALGARAAVEGALDQALAAGMRGDRLAVGDHVVEAELGRGDGEAHLRDLPVVLHESQLAHIAQQGGVPVGVDLVSGILGQLGVEQPPTVDLVGQLAVGFPDDAGRGIGRLEHPVELADRFGRERQIGSDVRERGTRAEPELADRRVGVKLVGVASGGGSEVQRGVMAVGARLHDQHAVRHCLGAPARQVRERGVRTVRVVRVVAAHLGGSGRDDEALTGMHRRDAQTTCCRGGRDVARRGKSLDAFGPLAGDVVLEPARHRRRRPVLIGLRGGVGV